MGKVDNYNDGLGLYTICSTPNTCKNDPSPTWHFYRGSPLWGLLWSYSPLKGCGDNHLGARDFALKSTKEGTPVYAAEGGHILQLATGYTPCGCNPTSPCDGANFVGIRGSDQFITHYVHVNPLPSLKLGDPVMLGQQIGTVDLSGDSCGPHVHMARYDSKGIPNCRWGFDITIAPVVVSPF
ncbi:M23 family metallopeptidase [Bacillus paramycoides]|uniref:M23 family metallopeptidase n=1 Tax=Bacillus paramycoides TaxID=2026194 RepID=UPI003D064B34